MNPPDMFGHPNLGLRNRWVLCGSKTYPGRYYYFNIANGEATWCFDDERPKPQLRPNTYLPRDNRYHPYPEPVSPPMDYQNPHLPFPRPHKPYPNYFKSPPRYPGFPQNPYVEDLNWGPNKVNRDTQTLPETFEVDATDLPLSLRFRNLRCTPDKTAEISNTDKIRSDELVAKKPIYDKILTNKPNMVPKNLDFNKSDTIAKNLNYKQTLTNQETVAKKPKYDAETQKDTEIMKFKQLLAQRFEMPSLSSSERSESKIQKPEFHSIFSPPHENIEQVSKNIDKTVSQNEVEIQNVMEIDGEKVGKHGTEKGNDVNDTGLDKNDLRYILMARRNKKEVVETQTSSNIKTIKTPEKKKCVTFNLNQSSPIIYEDRVGETRANFGYDHIDLFPGISKPTVDKLWYLSTDLNGLIEHFASIQELIEMNGNLNVIIAYEIKKELDTICSDFSQNRQKVIAARRTSREIQRLRDRVLIQDEDESKSEIYTENPIINCCIQKHRKGHYVALLTEDENLSNKAKKYNLLSLKSDELLNYLKSENTAPTFDVIKNTEKPQNINTKSPTQKTINVNKNSAENVQNETENFRGNTENGKEISGNTQNEVEIAKRFELRKDEWICLYVQLMEDALCTVSQNFNNYKINGFHPPRTLCECVFVLMKMYENNVGVKRVCEEMYELLTKHYAAHGIMTAQSFVQEKVIKRIFALGVELLEKLKNIPDCKQISEETLRSLNFALNNMMDPSLDPDYSLIDLIVHTYTAPEDDFISDEKKKVGKARSEVRDYLKKNYPHLQNYGISTDTDENIEKEENTKILRTTGRHLSNCQIDRHGQISVNAKNDSNYASFDKSTENVRFKRKIDIIDKYEKTTNMNNDLTTNINDKMSISQEKSTHSDELTNIIEMIPNDRNVTDNNFDKASNGQDKSFKPDKITKKYVKNADKIINNNYDRTSNNYYNNNDANTKKYDANNHNFDSNNFKYDANIHNFDANTHNFDANLSNPNPQSTKHINPPKTDSTINHIDKPSNNSDKVTVKSEVSSASEVEDSGIVKSEESFKAESLVRVFLHEMGVSFLKIHSFLEVTLDKINDTKIKNDERNKICDKTESTYRYLTNLSKTLKDIIQRESSNCNSTLKMLLINSGYKTDNVRIYRYRQILIKCLEQTQLLTDAIEILLKIMKKQYLSVEEKNTDENNAEQYLNIFEY